MGKRSLLAVIVVLAGVVAAETFYIVRLQNQLNEIHRIVEARESKALEIHRHAYEAHEAAMSLDHSRAEKELEKLKKERKEK